MVCQGVAVDEQLCGGLRRAVVAEEKGVQGIQQTGTVEPVIGGQNENGGMAEVHGVLLLAAYLQGVVDGEFVIEKQAFLTVEQLAHLQSLVGFQIGLGQLQQGFCIPADARLQIVLC